MYFEDLTKYCYERVTPLKQVVNVGWLERPNQFESGVVDPAIWQLLVEYFDVLTANQTRGYYECTFCSTADAAPYLQVGAQSVEFGAAELWIPDHHGLIFAVPDLVVHYMQNHSYCPPKIFIEAVERLPVSTINWNSRRVATELCRD